MPARGYVREGFAPKATVEQCRLAAALQELYAVINPPNMVAISKELGFSEGSVSHYLHARRTPSLRTVEQIHDLAVARQQYADTSILPCTKEELIALHAAAARSPCPRCAPTDPVPVSAPARRGDRRNSAALVAAPRRGDRRNTQQVSPPGRGGADGSGGTAGRQFVADVVAAPDSERPSLLWSLGGTISHGELAATLATLSAAGLQDEVDTLMSSAEAHERNLGEVVKNLLGMM